MDLFSCLCPGIFIYHFSLISYPGKEDKMKYISFWHLQIKTKIFFVSFYYQKNTPKD